MLPRITSSSAALLFIISLSLILPEKAAAIALPAYMISPDSVAAEKAFKLSLIGGSWDCGATFSRESVTVTDKRIDLSFVENSNLIIDPPILLAGNPPKGVLPICAYDLAATADPELLIPAYAPVFSMPALKAGTYEVWATQMYECMYSEPMCKMAVQQKYAGVLQVTADGGITYSINPTRTEADKDFTLNLLSYDFNCGTTYDMLANSVTDNTISLTFLDHLNPAALCPAIYKPYGPAYKLAGLKAGTYKVIAYRLPACAAQGCKMAAIPVDAGTLVVGDTEREGWFLKYNEARSDKAFTMQLLNNKYGNCQTGFSHQTVGVSDGAIWTSFLIENHPDHVCIQDLRPYGPSFEMEPLKIGKYPVYVTELLACEVTVPLCAVKRVMPEASDTLVVTATSAILVPGRSAPKPAIEFQGRRLNLSLPPSKNLPDGSAAESWRVELMTLSGQVLTAYQVEAKKGGTVSFDAGVYTDRGIYILRLRSPAGEVHMLSAVRKD